jgi:hypothetical protein
MVAEIKKKRYVYYHCSGYRGKCPEPYLRQERLETHMVSVLRRLHCAQPATLQIEKAIKEQGREASAQRRNVATVTSAVSDEGRLVRNAIELMEMAHTAHSALPDLTISMKRQMLGLLLAECSWADGALTVSFRPPFDLLARFAGADGGAGEREELLTSLVSAVARPDAAMKQLIARYNAMVRLRDAEMDQGQAAAA